MEVNNQSITQFQDSINAALLDIDLKNVDTNTSIDNINTNLDVDATDISLILISTVGSKLLNENATNTFGDLSDQILKYGKDLLLMADQADQFICVSNVTFSRVVDIYLHLNAREFEDIFLIDLIDILALQTILDDYLISRISNVTAVEATATQSQAIIYNDAIQAAMNAYIVKFTDVVNLFSDSLHTLEIFKNVLKVNATVGIALSVSKPAWDELKIMSLLNYSTDITVEAEVLTVEETPDFSTNTLLPDYGAQDAKAILDLPKLFIENTVVDTGVYKYTAINKKDLVTLAFDVDPSFNPFNTADITNIVRAEPDILFSIFGDVVFVNQLDLTDGTLTTYYDTLVAPTITVDEFIAEFRSPTFIDIITKYIGTIDAPVVAEYIESNKQRKQFMMFKDACSANNVNTMNFSYDVPMIEDGKLFEDVVEHHPDFNIYVTTYIKDLYIAFKQISDYSNGIIALSSEYHILNQNTPLSQLNNSGEIKILEYSNASNTLTDVVQKYKYSYKIYQDDLIIYYAELKINDTIMIIRDNQLVISYNILTEATHDIEHVKKESRNITLDLNLTSYLTDHISTSNAVNLAVYKEDTELVVESKLIGTKDETLINIESVDTGVITITKTENNTETIVSYISDDPVERIATNITNIYRDQLLAGEMDFSQARVNSIISSLRFLRYRDELETYIDTTWDMGIPHPNRG